MFIAIVLLVVGLSILIVGAELLVKGAASLARRLRVRPLVIGLTVVAFGTSAPELIVNIFSAVKGAPDIAIGNIVGSNISNILLILGIAAIIIPLRVQNSTVKREIPFALLAAVLVFVLGNDILFDQAQAGILSRTDGLALISMFAIFMAYVFGMKRDIADNKGDSTKVYSTGKSVVYVVAGVGLLLLGGKLLVDEAVVLARIVGLSESLIGLTIVAVGTSLPELATSVVAAIHRQNDIAIGNIIGSNIFNVFWILGLTSIILPLPFNAAVNIDVLMMIASTVMLLTFLFIGRRELKRWQGVAFIVCYIAYLIYLAQRG
ncbi:MAG: calcium/sodium antiporter [Patescibacteria group bacterium]